MPARKKCCKQLPCLRQNHEAAATLGEILRTAFLQGGGVSLEEFALELEQKKKAILSNWDIERDAPKNNRGIDNPYVQNVGLLLKAFYDKERLNRQLQAAVEAELEVETALQNLETVAAAKAALAPRKAFLEALEDDVIKRSRLEPLLGKLQLQEEQFRVVNRQWPQESERQKIYSRLAAGQERLTVLTAEYEAAKAAAAGKTAERLLTAKPLQEEIGELQQKLEALPKVTAGE